MEHAATRQEMSWVYSDQLVCWVSETWVSELSRMKLVGCIGSADDKTNVQLPIRITSGLIHDLLASVVISLHHLDKVAKG
jgi:hypothetical protein